MNPFLRVLAARKRQAGGPTHIGLPEAQWGGAGYTGNFVACKFDLSGSGDVGNFSFNVYRIDNTTREIRGAVWSHDSGNDRPDQVVAAFDRYNDADGTTIHTVTRALSAATLTTGTYWLSLLPEAPSTTRFYYTTAVTTRSLEVVGAAGEWLSGCDVGDYWTGLTNYASATVHTDRTWNMDVSLT